jgi:hypothetical protein
MKSGSVFGGAREGYLSSGDKVESSTSKIRNSSQIQRAADGPSAHTSSLLDQLRSDPAVANSFLIGPRSTLVPRHTTVSFGDSAAGGPSQSLASQSGRPLQPHGAGESDLAKTLRLALVEHTQNLHANSLIQDDNLGQHAASSSSPVPPYLAAASEHYVAAPLTSAQSIQDTIAENDWLLSIKPQFQSNVVLPASLQRASALENLQNANEKNDFNESLKFITEFLFLP